MLTHDASARQFPILLLLLGGPLSSSGFLLGRLAMRVQFLEPLIAAIGSTRYGLLESNLAALEQFDIVLASLAGGHTDDLACPLGDDELRRLRVAFLLAPGGLPWFF
jgi:hypothetical protein